MSSLGLMLALCTAASVDLDVHAAYGAGSRPALGALASVTVGTELWETKDGAGTLEGGLLLGYQAEPYAFSPPLPEAKVTGATHRLEGLFLVGSSMRLLSSRRLVLGLHLFGGWTHAISRGHLTNESLGIDRDTAGDAGRLTTGLEASLGVRLTEHLSLTARVLLPFPYASEVISYVIPALGLCFRL